MISAGVRLVFMTKSVTAWAGGRGEREVEGFRNLLEVSYSFPFPTQLRVYAERKGEGSCTARVSQPVREKLKRSL